MDKKLVSAADLSKIADLPSFEALRSQLLGLLHAERRGLRSRAGCQGQEGAARCSRRLIVSPTTLKHFSGASRGSKHPSRQPRGYVS
jgi:hypothetical protein